MINWFINAYVSNLEPHVAKQMYENIKANTDLTRLFYDGNKYLYPKGSDIISYQNGEPVGKTKAREEIFKTFNQFIREAFEDAYNKKIGTKPEPVRSMPLTQPAPAAQPTETKEITRFDQIVPSPCTPDTESLHLSMYPNLQDLTGLGQCKNLKRLYLENTKVSDIQEIGKLTNLEELNLSSTRVESLLPLLGYASYEYMGQPVSLGSGLKKLKTLKVYGIKKISGAKLVKEKLQQLTIKSDPGTQID